MNTNRKTATLPYLSGACLIVAHACGVGYLERVVPNIHFIQLALYEISLFFSGYVWAKRRYGINREFILILSFFLYLSAITVINDANLMNVGITAFVCIVFSFFIMCVDYDELLVTFRFWVAVLTTLVCIDVITMYLFPYGLYATVHARSVYYINWFLGYKTARVAYSLPMLLCSAIVSISQEGTIGKKFICLSIIAIIDTYMSYGTTALIGIIFFIVGTYIISKLYKYRLLSRLTSILFKPKVFFYVLLFFWIYTIILQDNEFFFTSVTESLDKSETLSGRTFIWSRCMEAVRKSGWMGIGVVDGKTMESITNGMVNAHSQLLTILLNGGVPAVIWYVVMSYKPMQHYHHTLEDRVLQLYVYTIFIIGLVSSVLTYSPFLFMILILIDRRKNGSLWLTH